LPKGKKEDDFVSGGDDRIDFRLILTHLVRKIVAHKMRRSSIGTSNGTKFHYNGRFSNCAGLDRNVIKTNFKVPHLGSLIFGLGKSSSLSSFDKDRANKIVKLVLRRLGRTLIVEELSVSSQVPGLPPLISLLGLIMSLTHFPSFGGYCSKFSN
jgi:hypothetical protein